MGLPKNLVALAMRGSTDLYEGEHESHELELVVLQININPGYNEEIKKSCRTLGEYTKYVEKVRHYK